MKRPSSASAIGLSGHLNAAAKVVFPQILLLVSEAVSECLSDCSGYECSACGSPLTCCLACHGFYDNDNVAKGEDIDLLTLGQCLHPYPRVSSSPSCL